MPGICGQLPVSDVEYPYACDQGAELYVMQSDHQPIVLLILHLHLDQVEASSGGSTLHGGEYGLLPAW